MDAGVKQTQGRKRVLSGSRDFPGNLSHFSSQDSSHRGVDVSPNPLQPLTILYFLVQEGH